jgi:hypothetical protein
MRPFSVTLALLAFGAVLPAQTIVVPSGNLPGITGVADVMPMCANRHFQVVLRADVLSPAGKQVLITGLAFGLAPIAFMPGAGGFTVQLGYADKTPATMTRSFARNAIRGLSTVFLGTLAAAPAGAGAHQFLDVPLSAPFAYDPTLGALLLDVAVGSTGASFELHTPSVRLASSTAFGPAATRVFMETCQERNEITTHAFIDAATGSLHVQHTVYHEMGQSVLVLLGSSTEHWGQIQLPLDLGLYGAPGNSLLIAPDTVLPGTGVIDWSLGFPWLRDGVDLRLPWNPAMAGIRYHVQALVVGGQTLQHPLDVSLSDANTVVLGQMREGQAQMLVGSCGYDLGTLPETSNQATAFRAPVLQITMQ